MRILDATCSNRGMWYIKDFPGATYIDIRPEVNPDRVEDCRHTSFPDKEFDLIVFDPPHMNIGEGSYKVLKYGVFKTSEILNLVPAAFAEFDRILKDEGFVLFKWNTHHIKLSRVLALLPKSFSPLFGQQVSLRTKHSSQTYWVCLLKCRHNLHCAHQTKEDKEHDQDNQARQPGL